MRTYKLTIAYDGTRYQGWQRQANTERTIQGILENVISDASGNPVEVDIAFFISTGFETGFTLDYISRSNPGLLVTYYPVEKVIYLF